MINSIKTYYGLEIKYGDIIDIKQTVNGFNLFLVYSADGEPRAKYVSYENNEFSIAKRDTDRGDYSEYNYSIKELLDLEKGENRYADSACDEDSISIVGHLDNWESPRTKTDVELWSIGYDVVQDTKAIYKLEDDFSSVIMYNKNQDTISVKRRAGGGKSAVKVLSFKELELIYKKAKELGFKLEK